MGRLRQRRRRRDGRLPARHQHLSARRRQESIKITPIPAAGGYWGLLRHNSGGATQNLSGFANGSLNVWIKTNNYPDKIEIGIASDTESRGGAEAYLQLSPGNLGYCNTNAWCQVSIPIAEFLRANPKLDLRAVTLPFVVADRFGRALQGLGVEIEQRVLLALPDSPTC